MNYLVLSYINTPDPKQQIKINVNSSFYASPEHLPNSNPSKDNRRLISL